MPRKRRVHVATQLHVHKSTPLLEDYWTKLELAAHLGRDPQTIDRWHRRGIGPPRIKLGRKPLYKKSDVRAWLESQATC